MEEDESKLIWQIKVSEFMIYDPFYITPEEKISTTELLMLRKKIGGLPVIKDINHKRVLGIITQRDIRLARFAMTLDSPNTRVKDLMSSDPIVVYKEDPLQTVLGKMINNNVERLPVVDEKHELIGLITKQSIIEGIYKYLKK